ncbi:MAG: HNH endonuclease [Gaiellaceae bacterium]
MTRRTYQHRHGYRRRQLPPMTPLEKLFMATIIATGGLTLLLAVVLDWLWRAARWTVTTPRRRRMVASMTPAQLVAYRAITWGGVIRPASLPLYLKTEWWAQLRRVVRARAGGRCEECGRRGPVEVHHRHYLTLCFEDPYRDLDALCRWCHLRRPRMRGQRLRVGLAPRRIKEHQQPERRRVTGRPVAHHQAGLTTMPELGPGDRSVDPAWVFRDPDDGVGF